MTKSKIPQDITAYFAKYGREGARERAKKLSPNAGVRSLKRQRVRDGRREEAMMQVERKTLPSGGKYWAHSGKAIAELGPPGPRRLGCLSQAPQNPRRSGLSRHVEVDSPKFGS